MSNFNNRPSRDRNRNPRDGSFNRGGSQRRSFGDRNRPRPQMHEAICSECGKKCEVPFKPTGSKPIYCSQCFAKQRDNSTSYGSERRSYGRPKFQEKKMFSAICDSCGKRFELPFKPNGSRPVYCSQCFERENSSSGRGNDRTANQYKEQFDMLNVKLDRLIKALVPNIQVKKEQTKVVAKKTEPLKKKEVIVKKKKVVTKKKTVAKKKKVVAKKKKVVAKKKKAKK